MWYNISIVKEKLERSTFSLLPPTNEIGKEVTTYLIEMVKKYRQSYPASILRGSMLIQVDL